MNHEVYQQHVSQLVDNELSESLEQDLFLHLGSCRECRSFLKSSWQIQNDILTLKPKLTARAFQQSTVSQRLIDRNPIPLMVDGKHTRRISTVRNLSAFALMLLMLLVGGLLFSTEVEVQNPRDRSTDVQRMSPSENLFVR